MQAFPTPRVNRPPRPVQSGSGRSVTPSSTQLVSLARFPFSLGNRPSSSWSPLFGGRQSAALPDWTSVVAVPREDRHLVSSGGLFARRHRRGHGRADVDSGEARRNQRIRPRWCRGEHATTGADQTPGPRPVSPSSEGHPLLAVSGSLWGPAEVSSQVPWNVGGTLPLRVYRGPEQSVVPQSTCPGSSWRQGSHLPYTSTGLLRQQRHLTIVPGWHVGVVHSATEVAVRAWFWPFLVRWGSRAATTPQVILR